MVILFHQGIHRAINITDIILVQSHSNYSTIYLKNGQKILTSKTLKHWCQEINHLVFKRVHASFFINPYEIKTIQKKTATIQMNNGILVKYSRRFDINNLINRVLTHAK